MDVTHIIRFLRHAGISGTPVGSTTSLWGDSKGGMRSAFPPYAGFSLEFRFASSQPTGETQLTRYAPCASGRYFHVFDLARWSRRHHSILKHAFDMKDDGLFDFFFDLGNRVSRRDATRKIGRICREIIRRLFYDYCVTHESLPPACLFEDAALGSWGDVVAWFAGNRHATLLCGVFELAMTSLCGDQKPPILFQQGQ